MHPFVALMRRYCIDYTNSHDQSVCDSIMEPDYVVHIGGFDLPRDTAYKPVVADLFERAPGLGLLVHDFVLNGDRLCMRFSEHAAMPTGDGSALACWRGIGLYQWNGQRLTENWVEQDHLAMQQQLMDGVAHEVEPPHLDPWVGTEPIEADERAEVVTRAWLEAGDLADASWAQIDDTPPGSPWSSAIEATTIRVDDLFSAGSRVPFHITITGAYTGAIPGVPAEHVGAEVTLPVSGIAEVRDGRVEAVRAVTSRAAVRYQLTGASPI
jgi:hypothetical protein